MAKIDISDLKDVTWMDRAGCDYSASDHVDLWRINIDANFSMLDAFEALMTSEEKVRAAKYHFDKDKKRFIVSRGALRNILGRYTGISPADLIFEIGDNKKPYINNSKVQYNLSHSGEWILLAVSNTLIGADVELINNTFAFNDVLQDNFSQAEIDYIDAADATARFFKLWTRKEAFTKATGKGLDGYLSGIPALDGSHNLPANLLSPAANWSALSFVLDCGYIASVVCDKVYENLRFWDISFSS